MEKQSEALRLAEQLETEWPEDCDTDAIAAELRRLHEENRKLKTVMVAAAEEISANWEAHCDSEGYGPANLMRRLEQGIASEYGYTAGAFAKLKRINNQLLEALQTVMGDANHGQHMSWSERCRQARAAIAAASDETSR